MKEIMIFSIAAVLLSTLGCNYDYGKYGTEKTDSNSEKTQAEETSPR